MKVKIELEVLGEEVERELYHLLRMEVEGEVIKLISYEVEDEAKQVASG